MMPIRLLTTTAAVLTLVSAVHAQSTGPAGPVPPEHFMVGPMPVDQAVSDVDPLARSLRRLEPGNAMYSPRVRITELQGTAHAGTPQVDPATGLALPTGYRYAAPGVQAIFNRPDYLVRTGTGRRDIARNVAPAYDGAIQELIPAGTVFDLRPEAALHHLLPQINVVETPHDWEDRRIDSRYRIDGRVTPTTHSATSQAIDRQLYPHIPEDTPIPSRLPRRFTPDE